MGRLITLIITFSLGTVPLWAQHNNRSARHLQFQFGNPSARALGMGGAFVAIANDATAAIANPAGMWQLSQPECLVEFQGQWERTSIPFSGGEIRQTNLFSFNFDLEETTLSRETARVHFLGLVWPLGSWRLGLVAHQLADVDRAYTTDWIRFYPLDAQQFTLAYFPSTDEVLLDIQKAGVSLARQWGTLAVGFSAFVYRFDYRSNATTWKTSPSGLELPEFHSAQGTDHSLGLTSGLHWQPADRFTVGLVYTHSSEFDYLAIKARTTLDGLITDFERESRFTLPRKIAFGVALAPGEFSRLTLDINRVFYSDLMDDFVDFVQTGLVTQTIEDTTELRMGFEHMFLEGLLDRQTTLRMGYAFEPYHALINTTPDSQLFEGDYTSPQSIALRDAFFLHRFAEDQQHYSLGLGLDWSRNLILDFAVSYSESAGTTLSAGASVRFNRSR
jgi:long-subunit fatty acid transport protein